MSKFGEFLKRKDIEISLKRYGIDALGAMAQGLFCSLLVGTILNTIGTQFNIGFLTKAVATVGETSYTVGGIAIAMCGPAMAVAIGYALKADNGKDGIGAVRLIPDEQWGEVFYGKAVWAFQPL